MRGDIVRLDANMMSDEALEFEKELRSRLIGQDRAIRTVMRALQVWRSGLSPKGRPIANLLMLGPTGVGKTHIVEVLAELMFGSKNAAIKIDCGEFQHGHEVSKLLGSPPGYIGAEREPRITNKELERYYTKDAQISFVLFDEIEKAHEELFDLLLGILDKATLMLGDGKQVDFSKSMVFLTSNLASREMSELASGGIGFKAAGDDGGDVDKKIYKTAVKAASRHFSPEFMNRFDRTVVFHSLRPHHLEQILEVELKLVQERITLQAPWQRNFVFRVTPAGKGFLLQEGIDVKYGARHLKRAIERHLVAPIANLLTTGQLGLGDILTVDYEGGSYLTFTNNVEGALIDVRVQKFPLMTREASS